MARQYGELQFYEELCHQIGGKPTLAQRGLCSPAEHGDTSSPLFPLTLSRYVFILGSYFRMVMGVKRRGL